MLDPEHTERSAHFGIATPVVASLESKQLLQRLFGRIALAAECGKLTLQVR